MKNESILDHQELSARLFYPWPHRFPDPFYVDGKDGKLGCWHNREFPDGLTMVHFHGNGETVADYLDEFTPRIASLGVNLFLAEYRGYGMSEGEPKLAAMLADIPAIVAASGAKPSRRGLDAKKTARHRRACLAVIEATIEFKVLSFRF